jgi:hypothetical protein
LKLLLLLLLLLLCCCCYCCRRRRLVETGANVSRMGLSFQAYCQLYYVPSVVVLRYMHVAYTVMPFLWFWQHAAIVSVRIVDCLDCVM